MSLKQPTRNLKAALPSICSPDNRINMVLDFSNTQEFLILATKKATPQWKRKPCEKRKTVKACKKRSGRTPYSRFSFAAHGQIEYYAACDLDEQRAYYWSGSPTDPYRRLRLSNDLDEVSVLENHLRLSQHFGTSKGVFLSDSDKQNIENILAEANYDRAKSITNSLIESKTEGWCYRDGWTLDFVLEGESGYPPIITKDICYCSFQGDEELFEKLESYLFETLGLAEVDYCVPLLNENMTPERERKMVAKACMTGIDAVYQILWSGKPAQIELLESVPHKTPFSYTLDAESFSLRYGSDIIRACKLCELPNCHAVLGPSHVFLGAPQLP